MPSHLMIVPSLACPASCKYCFGPHEGGPTMSQKMVATIVAWQSTLGNKEPLEITFHGGEPLIPGAEFYRMALPLLRNGLKPGRTNFAIQSNLWLLTEELCDLFREYGVSIGTSLDGPEQINDAQRSAGHFRKTMAMIDLARKRGISISCICTFTSQSVRHAQEIFDFFVYEGLNFTIHEAVPSLRHPDTHGCPLAPEAYGELLIGMLDRYLAHLDKVRIHTLDALCRSVSAGKGGICTFGDCLGEHLAIAPNGEMYPCQRFVGMTEYRIGYVQNAPSIETLSMSPIWQAFQERQNHIQEACGDCPYLNFCRGGCPYNALAANFSEVQNFDFAIKSKFNMPLRDPNCPAYHQIFKKITDQALAEVFSEENIHDVVERLDPTSGLLRRGKLIALMRDGPHPYDTAQHARRIVAAVVLAATNSPETATQKFQQLGLITHGTHIEMGMRELYQRLTKPVKGLNNLYLHVTFACPLRCTHCYAQAGPEHYDAMTVETIIRVCQEAADLGFRQTVITGGEPLVHPQRDRLLDALAEIRATVKPMLTVLRTSLSVAVDDELLRQLGNSTDQVVVSLDGDRDTHDRRRGAGNYDRVVGNLRQLVNRGYHNDLSLATVLPLQLANGMAGEAVRALAEELGIWRIRFRPILPLGRARETEPDLILEASGGPTDFHEMMTHGFHPVSSCGIGQNLEIMPDGSVYPCYAWHGTQWWIDPNNAVAGLEGIVMSEKFQELGKHTINTNRQCRVCALRYLCGGACRAWNRQADQEQQDIDAPPGDCSSLFTHAKSLLVSALEHLNISGEQWKSAGLLLPDSPLLL
jgi:uncharacterized protein